MKKILRSLKLVHLDVFIYSIKKETAAALPDIPFEIRITTDEQGRKKYSVYDGDVFVHSTMLVKAAHMLRLIGKKGPTTSTAVTNPDYRGRSVYPYIMNRIAMDVFAETQFQEVFGIVDKSNASSIRGLEKAGYKPLASIKGMRFLLFYFNVRKQLPETNV